MADKKIRLQIITPTEKKVDEAAEMVIMRCVDGNMGILAGHEAHSAVLDYGIMRILNGGDERQIVIYGGLAVIESDTVTVLTNEAEWPEEIDHARANADREHIERHLREKTDDFEIKKDRIRLRRALMQIEVSSPLLLNSQMKQE